MTAQVVDKEKLAAKQEHSHENEQSSIDLKEQSKQPELKQDVGEVSEFMEGLDVPKSSEKVSERVSEDDKKQQGSKKQKTQGGDDDFSFDGLTPLKLPSQRIMVRRIRKELHKEIKQLLKQAKREEKKGAYYLTDALEKVRNLQGLLKNLATATYEVIKNMYISLFDKKEKDVK